MKKVFTVGVFDLLHYGHIELFRRAKEYGEHLTVAVQTSEFVTKFKPNAKLIYSTNERLYMVNAIRYVDFVTTYDSVDEIVKIFPFDIFIIGEDQCHNKFKKAIQWCKENNKEVIMLPRTKGISTSFIKSILSKNT